MEEKVQINRAIGKAYLPQVRAIVSFTNPGKSSSATTAGDSNADGAAQVIPAPLPIINSNPYAYWGDNNNLPNEIIELIGKCGVAGAALLYNILAAYGSGIEFGQFVYDGGKKIFEPLDITQSKYSEINDFFLESDIQDDYLLESISDLTWFYNFFPYFILNKGRDKINKLFVSEAAYTRYKLRDEKSNKITHIGVNSDWINYNVNNTIEIPVLSEYDPVADLQSRTSGYLFAVPGGFPTPGKSYYQKPYWDAVRANGWIENSISVPKYLKAVFKNTMHLKYHIRIPDIFWSSKYKEWESKSEEEQLKLMEVELDAMDKFLSGTDNAKKSFISHFSIDRVTNKEVPGWSIEVIEDYDKDGKYLPESSAANSEILFAFQVHPDLIGAGTPGGGYSKGGSGGSNTRETDLIKKSLLSAIRHRSLKPIYYTKRYNKWPAEVQFRIDDTVLTTLDNGSQAIKTIGK